jgi:hypothetical protein
VVVKRPAPRKPSVLDPLGDPMLRAVVFDPLARPTGAPDLSEPIMRRLGYARVDRHRHRRDVALRWTARGVMGLVAVASVVLAVHLHGSLPQARRPSDITIPAAIERAVHQNGIRLMELIDRVQTISHPGESGEPGAWNRPAGPLDATEHDQGDWPISEPVPSQVVPDLNTWTAGPFLRV